MTEKKPLKSYIVHMSTGRTGTRKRASEAGDSHVFHRREKVLEVYRDDEIVATFCDVLHWRIFQRSAD